ncbi:PREDICTED: glutathione S-transferase T3-like [Brassica oleracea var. oleracea]|uniref:glutathione S-transferase T3-like n=1 Tax=Brassica oleracea var. oleracea TaxID=109376 RepID=UPI0006A6BBC8|nr:PREDICTED: glutathione S-transferase T3-like [Brassica oleracea var. oleracea]
MDSYPSSHSSKFVDLLNSQQNISFGNYEESVSLSSSQAVGTEDGGETGTQRTQRWKWTSADDILLISSWLNTSKDPVVSNEQRSGTFWSRVAVYFAASRQDGGCEREALHCKQRWHKINDLVCKFRGAYEAASRERTSGQNENDVLKLAHQIFYTNHKKKFLLEHVWKVLRNDQKWCEALSAKNERSSKKRKCEDGGDSSSSQANDMKWPPGVKASKARGKQTMGEEKAMKEFETMWSIRQQDLGIKERLSKMRLLDSLIAKKEPLVEYEEALKKKLSMSCCCFSLSSFFHVYVVLVYDKNVSDNCLLMVAYIFGAKKTEVTGCKS